MEIVELSPGDERLAHAFPVIKELRTHLDEREFNSLYETAYPEGLRIAAIFDDDECRAVAGYRIYTNLVSGKHLYVDDLVTAEPQRSRGHGRLLNEYLVDKARNENCASIRLDSATERREAHRFYFRERYTIFSFHFARILND